MQILEAFRALNALNEDVFSLDADGIKGLSDFKNNDDFEDDISIIDPEAETAEDLQDNYIGKVILDCCVCHSKLYKAKEEVTIDENGELANVGEECPYCFTPDGFKVIGEVAAFEDKVDEEADEKEEEAEEEEKNESLQEGIFDKFKKNKDDGTKYIVWRKDERGTRPYSSPMSKKEADEWATSHKKNGVEYTVKPYDAEEVRKARDAAGMNDDIQEGIFGIKTKKEKASEAKRIAEDEDERKSDEEAEERRERARQQSAIDSWKSHDANKKQAELDYNRNRYNSIKGDKSSNTGHRGVSYSGGDYYSEDLEEGLFDFGYRKRKKEVDRRNAERAAQLDKEFDERAKKARDDWEREQREQDARSRETQKRLDAYDAAKRRGSSSSSTSNTARAGINYSGGDYYTESLDESIEDLSMTANDTHVEIGEDENGKVTVTMEPATADGGEMIAPVSDETEAELLGADEEAPVDGEEPTEEAPAEDEVDIEVDEVDEESMDELGESYFKRVYENVNGFRTTAVRQNGNSLVVEGKIKFNSGKVRKTSFMFEALDATKAGKVRFVGDNKNLTEGKKAFMLTGKMKGNKLIAESLNYNYKHKDAEGKVSRVYGTERTSRR